LPERTETIASPGENKSLSSLFSFHCGCECSMPRYSAFAPTEVYCLFQAYRHSAAPVKKNGGKEGGRTYVRPFWFVYSKLAGSMTSMGKEQESSSSHFPFCTTEQNLTSYIPGFVKSVLVYTESISSIRRASSIEISM